MPHIALQKAVFLLVKAAFCKLKDGLLQTHW